MTVLHFDIETRSEVDLKAAGVYRYAEHESTSFWVMGYRFDDGPVHQWWSIPVPKDMQSELRALRPAVVFHFDDQCPADLRRHIEHGGETRAHNHQFERVVLNGNAGEASGFPVISIEQTVCTAAKMAASGLPRALGEAAKALGTHLKSDQGRIEMLQLAKPRKLSKANQDMWWTPITAPEKFIAAALYNIDDVLAEYELDESVPDLTPAEQKVYELDQRINARGIAVDLTAIDNILSVVNQYKEQLAQQCEEITADFLGVGLKPTQRDKIADWIRENGWPKLLDMQAETVKALVLNPDVPSTIKLLLKIYSTYNAKAITKYQAILDAVCVDGRLRGMFLYHGAGTARWSSLIVQLQNLFRPVIDDPEAAIDAFAARDIEWIKDLYPGIDPIKVAASCVRSVLIGGEGKDLIYPDFAGIETRINAWFFDEEWKVQAFRNYDAGTGPDLYKLAVARSFGIPVEEVDKTKRQWGKVQELALGYEGGVGAFVTMVDTYGIKLDELAAQVLPILPEDARESAEWMWQKFGANSGIPYEQYIACDGLKYLWRQGHPGISKGWKQLKQAAEQACEFPGKGFAIPNGKIAFKVIEYKGRSWLNMRLPSGRCIRYFNPRWIPEIRDFPNQDGKERVVPGEMRYWGVDTYTRQWMELSTYGGKLDENADQGYARDLLVTGMLNMEEAGYQIVGTVHDEIIAEQDEAFGSFEHAGRMMLKQPKHADGLPLAVDGKRAKRYSK